jgi:hypothetical protein
MFAVQIGKQPLIMAFWQIHAQSFLIREPIFTRDKHDFVA